MILNTNVDTTKTITHISLCSGYGGIDMGLKRVIPTLRTIAYSEREAFVCANLVSKMEKGLMDPAPIWSDLKTFPWSEFRGKVDIVSGGYPCQPFSHAGQRKGTEDERHLWPFIREGIRQMQPAMCFWENVEGHITIGLSTVISDLEEDGYRCSWGIFSASEVGCVHQRKRVFILAYNQNLGIQGCWPDWIKEPQSYVGERLSMCQGDGGEQAMVDSSSSTNSKEGLSEERRLSEVNRETICTRQSGGTTTNVSNSNDIGSGESGTLQQGSDGSESVSNGEQGGTELANSEFNRLQRGSQSTNRNSERKVCEQKEIGSNIRSKVSGCSRDTEDELADTNFRGQSSSINSRSSTKKNSRGKSNTIKASGIQPDELAHSQNIGCRGGKDRDRNDGQWIQEQEEQIRPILWSEVEGCSRNPAQPARPGQQQYWWEPPRVIANNKELGDTLPSTLEESRRASRELLQESERLSGGQDQGEARYLSGSSSQTGDIQTTSNEIEPSLGGSIDGPSSWMVYAELCHSVDNRTDELRLLGNGVVPATATRAFLTLSKKLFND